MTTQRRDRAGYMRAYRASRPEYRVRERARANARNRALRRLTLLYPAEYGALLRDELRAAR